MRSRFFSKAMFFLSEKESLKGDNGISCKAGWMLAYKQNFN